MPRQTGPARQSDCRSRTAVFREPSGNQGRPGRLGEVRIRDVAPLPVWSRGIGDGQTTRGCRKECSLLGLCRTGRRPAARPGVVGGWGWVTYNSQYGRNAGGLADRRDGYRRPTGLHSFPGMLQRDVPWWSSCRARSLAKSSPAESSPEADCSDGAVFPRRSALAKPVGRGGWRRFRHREGEDVRRGILRTLTGAGEQVVATRVETGKSTKGGDSPRVSPAITE